MDRRKALRNMGLALGYTVATPTLISIVESCKQEPSFEWTPDFFSKDEGAVLTKLVDIILPKTDTPSASETQVHLFIDRFALEVMDEKQQNFVKMSMADL
ncbi:gluconate 2-dehydrogenase subunit 3 family protein [Winogradskyella maritima]|nr:gluconate 2-dehydrogenase subunit 3 family protein [Winogradskyella maritima]